jgi:hypothetical protein
VEPGRVETCDERSTPQDVTSTPARREGINLQQEVEPHLTGRSPRNSPPKDTAAEKPAAEMNIQVDRAAISVSRDTTFFQAAWQLNLVFAAKIAVFRGRRMSRKTSEKNDFPPFARFLAAFPPFAVYPVDADELRATVVAVIGVKPPPMLVEFWRHVGCGAFADGELYMLAPILLILKSELITKTSFTKKHSTATARWRQGTRRQVPPEALLVPPY